MTHVFPQNGQGKQLNILFVFPNRFAARNILKSDIPLLLAKRHDVSVTFVSLFPEDENIIKEFTNDRLSWRHLKRPAEIFGPRPADSLRYMFMNAVYKILHVLLLKRAGHDAMVYRFNTLNNFHVHRWWQERAKGAGHKPADVQKKLVDRKLGWPFPNSKKLFRFLLKLRYWRWGNNVRVENFFALKRFDLVVINFIQTSVVFPYVTAAGRRGIPVIGMVGSWDNPTTKGPLCPSSLYVVQNTYMVEKLTAHHHIEPEKIMVTGWPQMDLYKKTGIIRNRDEFVASMGLEEACRLIVFGTSTRRFGRHEPGIARHMLSRIEAGVYGGKVALVVRAHPADRFWRERLGELIGKANVVVESPDYYDRIHFVNLMKHADIVISSAGTISLDAVAYDTCAINIAFDGEEEVNPCESARRFYEFEHYASIVRTGGTRLVYSFKELDTAIVDYLQDPQSDAAARKALRDYHLAPFDGRASERLADIIHRTASKGSL